jgi:hypothetical protein
LLAGPFNNKKFDAPRSYIPKGPSTGFQDLRLKSLNINVNTTRQKDINNVFSHAEIPFREVVGLAHLNFDKVYPAGVENCLMHIKWLPELIGEALHQSNAGLTIRERVDKITYSVDGRIEEENNIADDLKEGRERELEEYKRRGGLGGSDA